MLLEFRKAYPTNLEVRPIRREKEVHPRGNYELSPVTGGESSERRDIYFLGDMPMVGDLAYVVTTHTYRRYDENAEVENTLYGTQVEWHLAQITEVSREEVTYQHLEYPLLSQMDLKQVKELWNPVMLHILREMNIIPPAYPGTTEAETYLKAVLRYYHNRVGQLGLENLTTLGAFLQSGYREGIPEQLGAYMFVVDTQIHDFSAHT